MSLPKFKKIDKALEERIKEVIKTVALSVDGVSSLPQKCVTIDRIQDGLELNVSVLVKYGSRIPVVAWDTQEKIMKSVSDITETKIKKVNVNIQGVE